ncbi:MAG: hypothetical protein VKK04_22370 [Synechococcales bacterium]|nr:hypothetical protein [Synechococcales bacterium]
MALDLVLNELSLEDPAPDAFMARQWMVDFIQTVRAVKAQAGRQIILRTQYDFYTEMLAPGYPVRRWLNDDEVDREEQRFIKTLVTKSPFSQDILNTAVQEIENMTGPCEFLHEGKVAIGLGAAYILDMFPVSVRSMPCWDYSYLDLEIIHADEENDRGTIVHASCRKHVHDHLQWFESRLLQGIHNGVLLWDRRNDLFPNLQFCDSVKKQLADLQAGSVMLNPIEKRLSDLQNCASDWTTGAFDPNKLTARATTESRATLNMYGQERTFACSDGQSRVFSWHVRLTPMAWRIHFYPIQPGEIIVGYIGCHLPTAKFR